MSDIIISGYHGFANSGDEALLWAIVDTLKKQKKDVSITVLSKKPAETARLYGVRSIYRYNLFKVHSEMKKARLLLFGGGSLLQDITSSKSLYYYLVILRMAQKCKIKTMLYANGIGPLIKPYNRKRATKVLNGVDVITLRDDMSDIELKGLNVTKPTIAITADPAFTLELKDKVSGKEFLARAGVPKDVKIAVVSVRPWKHSAENFASAMASLCDFMAENYKIHPLFVPMQYPYDLPISNEIIGKMKQKAYLLDTELSVPDIFSVISCAEIIIGMRLHTLIYATTLEVPAMALVYDPKISAFMESVNQPLCVNVDMMDENELKEKLNGLLSNTEQRKADLHETNVVLKEKAEENASYAIKLLS
ncbi:MAG: polysaccharide pyruvyl transferase CsaB [Bacillota bacterium]|nr:polysaccharide pyruvyl transferase CsaB [Bacillota bacterium]